MRIKGLDFLRGIAIIGVLFRHLEIDFFLSGPGGYGVDLFFVLSGFLVSGLLFGEYKKRKMADIKRFLIRRGFKIYPAFYFFIIACILIYSAGFGSYFPGTAILSEVFFLQSYLQPMWSHTWSLAVEEHFYFLLALLIFLSIKYHWIDNRKVMVSCLAGIILTSMILRLVYVYTVYRHASQPFYYTHLRIDGLFTGALLGYLLHFKQPLIDTFYRKKKLFAFLSFLFILPAFVLNPDSLFMVTFGFNLLHLAFAFAVLLLIHPAGEKILFGNSMAGKVSSAICTIGIYSYSIYLWHLPVQNILLRYVPDLRVESALYLLIAIGVGMFTAAVIEKPMLNLRDRYFPRRVD